MIYEVKNTASAGQLFEGWEETLIWSCLQGVMGKIYADRQGVTEQLKADNPLEWAG